MKRNLVYLIAISLFLFGCNSESKVTSTNSSSPSPQSSKEQNIKDPQQSEPKPSIPTTTSLPVLPSTSNLSTPSPQTKNISPSQTKVSFSSYEGNWKSGDSFHATVHFLDDQEGEKISLSLETVYQNAVHVVSTVPTSGVTLELSDDGKGNFSFSDSFGGTGTGSILLHDGVIEITLHYIQEGDAIFFDGLKQFSRSNETSIIPKQSTVFLNSISKIEQMANIPSINPSSGNFFPVSSSPDGTSPDGQGGNLYAWSVVPGGTGDGNTMQVYFFDNDKYLGTDTLKPHGKVLKMSPVKNGIKITYESSSEGTFDVSYYWDGKRLIPDDGFKNLDN